MNYELGGVPMQVEWRCWREDGSYGPPCVGPVDRAAHKWDHRHWDCCWIAYVEMGQDLEAKMDIPPDEEIYKLNGTIGPPEPPYNCAIPTVVVAMLVALTLAGIALASIIMALYLNGQA